MHLRGGMYIARCNQVAVQVRGQGLRMQRTSTTELNCVHSRRLVILHRLQRSLSPGGWAAVAIVSFAAIVVVTSWIYCLVRGCCCCCMPVDPPYAQTRATAAVQMKRGNDTDCCCFPGGPQKKVLYVHQIARRPSDVEGNIHDVLSVDDTTHLAIVARSQGKATLPYAAATTSDTATSEIATIQTRLPRPSEQRYDPRVDLEVILESVSYHV